MRIISVEASKISFRRITVQILAYDCTDTLAWNRVFFVFPAVLAFWLTVNIVWISRCYLTGSFSAALTGSFSGAHDILVRRLYRPHK